MTLSLKTLLREVELLTASPVPDLAVQGVADDSRQVQAGDLFVAVKGQRVDAHDLLREVARSGAVAAVGEAPLELDIPYFQVADSRRALAQIAAAWHDYPARRLTMIGVTGTDGKTTTANLLKEILSAAQIPTGMITSVNAEIGDETLDTGFHVTTPPAMQVQTYLDRMVRAGLTHCIIEATSHGLAQRRVAACDFDVGVVTNITHEHLDYHGTQEAYRVAKSMLFRSLSQSASKAHNPPRAAILNLDDSSYSYLRELTEVRQVTYGRESAADVHAVGFEQDESGLRFTARGDGYAVDVSSGLVGGYNLWNCLAAFACAVDGLGVNPETAARGIAALPGIPGRMERIDMGQDFTAIVDFAHTPNALGRALRAGRRLTQGRLIAVFGSAGERDREKRHMMAEVAAQLADVTVLTAEDPRGESLTAILDEMTRAAEAAGAVKGETLVRVPDRGQALREAVRMARPGDLVIALGKGHEQSMCFGNTEYPWDDRVAMRAALAEVLEVEGPDMPRLPTGEKDTLT